MRYRITDVISFLIVIVLIVGLTSFAMAAMINEGIRAVNQQVEVEALILNENRQLGDIIHLCADVSGTRNRYTVQWEQDSGAGWAPIPNATDIIYAYTLSEENLSCRYRVLMTVTN